MSDKIDKVLADFKGRGWNVEQDGYKYFIYRKKGSRINPLSQREVYKLHTLLFEKGMKIGNTYVKELTAGPDRAAARDAIKKEEFDRIPSKKRIKEIDPWSFD